MEKQKIEDIFRVGLENYEVLPDKEEWSSIELDLPKVKFFRFSVINFNIYYCSMIVMTFFFSIFTLVYTIIRSESYDNKIFVNHPKVKTDQDNNRLSQTEGSKFQREKKAISKNENLNMQASGSISESNTTKNAKAERSSVLVRDTLNKVKTFEVQLSDKSIKGEEKSVEPKSSENLSVIEQPKVEEKKSNKIKKVVYITKQDTIIVVDTLSKKNHKKKR